MQRNLKFAYIPIISPRIDQLVFLFPIFLAAPLLIFQGPILPSAFSFFIFSVSLDGAHIVASAYSVRDRVHRKKINWLSVTGIGLLIVAASLGIGFLSPFVLASTVATMSLVHVCQQQYGWMMICCRNAGEDDQGRWWDRIGIWNMMFFPIVFWLSPLSGVQKSYFQQNDLQYLAQLISGTLLNVVFVLHIALLILYGARLYLQAKKSQTVVVNKLALLAMTWVWFFGGLYLARSAAFFFAVLSLSHSAAYLFFVYKTSENTSLRGGRLKVNAALFGLSLLVGSGLYHTAIRLSGPVIPWTLDALLACPVLAHCVFDTFIWKRKMFVRAA